MTAALLEVSALDVSLGRGRKRTQVLHEVSLEVQPGRIVGLIGETGSGKTTLARSVLGLVPVQSGGIRFDGRELTRLNRRGLRDFRREGAVQYVFQDPLRSLDPDLTVRDCLVEGLAVRSGGARLRRAELDEAAERVAGLVSLQLELLPRHPGELSGGQRQRVAIARAMAVEPRLLICDEPVSALDASTRVRILELLLELRDSHGVSVVLITHDLGSVAGVADAVSVLYRGRIVESGTAERVLLDPHDPYTRLLLASVPALGETQPDPEARERLRAEVRELHGTGQAT